MEPPPEWLEIRKVQTNIDNALAHLDPGAQEAIQLAREQHADLLLIDEQAATRVARQQGFTVTGTLGVLVQAAQRNLVETEEMLIRLQQTNFRCTPALLERVRQQAKRLA